MFLSGLAWFECEHRQLFTRAHLLRRACFNMQAAQGYLCKRRRCSTKVRSIHMVGGDVIPGEKVVGGRSSAEYPRYGAVSEIYLMGKRAGEKDLQGKRRIFWTSEVEFPRLVGEWAVLWLNERVPRVSRKERTRRVCCAVLCCAVL